MNKPLLLSILLSGGIFSANCQTTTTTITYQQITSLEESHVGGQDWQHVISGNGNKIVWYKQTNPKQVFTANADGSGLLSIADWGSDRLSQVDINDDGTRVIYVGGPFSGGSQINSVNADGSSEQMLIALDHLSVKTIRLTGNGSSVFFNVNSNSTISGGGGPIDRGVYSIPYGGGVHSLVAGPSDVATALGISASDVGVFSGGSNGPTIDVSEDGANVIFIAENDLDGTHHVFTKGSSGVHHIFGPVLWVPGVGISSDGQKIAFTTNPSNREGYVANFDGSGLTMIASTDDIAFTDGNSRGDRICLTENGSKVMFDGSHIFNTDGSGVFQISANTWGSAGLPLILGYVERGTMDRSGTRILTSILEPVRSVYQMALIEIDPNSLDGSPSISDINMDPNGAVPNGQASHITMLVTPSSASDSIRYAGNVVLWEDLRTQMVWSGGFNDDGSTGDVTPDDMIYTHNNVFAYSSAELGSYKMRFNAEVYDSDYRLQATSVETEFFYVVADTSQLGLNDQTDPLIQGVFPNPVRDNSQLRIFLRQGSHVSWTMRNSLGQIVNLKALGWRGPGNWNLDLETNILPSGTYFLTAVSEHATSSIKLIVQ